MGLNYYASSPTVVLPARPDSLHQRLARWSYNPTYAGAKLHTPPSLDRQTYAAERKSSRKRSFDDADADDSNASERPIMPIPARFQRANKVRPMISPPSTVDMVKLDVPACIQKDLPRLSMDLGIGWKEVFSNAEKKDGARGWAKFISRNCPLTEPYILYESEAHYAFLVHARDAADDKAKFFMFDQDLRSYHLVGATVDEAAEKLVRDPNFWESVVPKSDEAQIAAPASNDVDMGM